MAASIFLLGNGLQAQDLERAKPKLPEAARAEVKPKNEVEPSNSSAASSGSDTVLLAKLEGIVFVSSIEKVNKEGRKDKGVRVESLPLLSEDPSFLKAVEGYLEDSLSFSKLNEISRLAVQIYLKKGRPVVDVFVPEQSIEGGTVQWVVMEGKLGEIRAVGNKWFRGDVLTDDIRSKRGGIINGRTVEADAAWLNQNPFRQVVPTFVRGKEVGYTDIELRTQDRFPLRVYTGYEDNGSDMTGDERWMAGFNWGDAFFLDHILSYQFTTSSNGWHSKAHSGSYTIPVPTLKHRMTFSGSYGTSNADVPAPFQMGGESWQVGGRYNIPLPTPQAWSWLTHEASWGFDFKQSNNNLEFGGTQVFDTVTDVAQWTAGYTLSTTDPLGTTRLSANAFWSPGQWASHNHDHQFLAARNDSQADYAYVNVGGERVTRLPWDFSSVTKGSFQFSDRNLLSSETLGVGGSNSVRGYDEREANGDEGWLFSQELRTPAVNPLVEMGWTKARDSLQFLAFWDYGVAEQWKPMWLQNKDVELSSAGGGLRYGVSSYMSVKFDYGWQLIDSGANRRYDSRGHLSVMFSY